MITKLKVFESKSFSAPENLAAEAVLTETAAPGESILYLWQNEKTVVIGRNQNAWKECRYADLIADGGTLVRRLSGGGAVFHDLGNLNVSFCLPRQEEDIPRQTKVILSALHSLGVRAAFTGRNDLTVDGKKFSGHAYWRQEGKSCHHATLMLKVDEAALEKYLNVSPLKLRSRGVDSVRARVKNLSDLYPRLTIPALCAALRDAFEKEYALPAKPFPWEERLGPSGLERFAALRERFASWEWTFGRRIPFDLEEQARFPWGEAQVQLKIDGGRIRSVKCFTDAMDPLWTQKMEEALTDRRFAPEDISDAFLALPPGTEPRMREDLEEMLVGMTEK